MIKKLAEKHAETIKKAGIAAQKINVEFKKSTEVAVITAAGLLAALSWQTTIRGYTDFLVKKLSLPQDPFVYNLYASIFITFLSVIVIMLVSRWGWQGQ